MITVRPDRTYTNYHRAFHQAYGCPYYVKLSVVRPHENKTRYSDFTDKMSDKTGVTGRQRPEYSENKEPFSSERMPSLHHKPIFSEAALDHLGLGEVVTTNKDTEKGPLT